MSGAVQEAKISFGTPEQVQFCTTILHYLSMFINGERNKAVLRSWSDNEAQGALMNKCKTWHIKRALCNVIHNKGCGR